jgi:hypothetical protein
MKNSSKLVKQSVLAVGLGLASGTAAQAQSADALIDKLVTKGVLTSDEAQELRKEADDGFTSAYKAKSGMADYVDAVRFNGDFRGRYDGVYKDAPGFVDRHRWRYRLRYGVTIDMMDSLEMGFRLGSGDIAGLSSSITGVDPISQNQSFQNNGAKKGIFIDLAYASWNPLKGPTWSAVTTIGKMENPFVFSDAVFDKDYTPEGVAQTFGYKLNSVHSFKAIGSAWALNEISGSSLDPYMFGGQVRWNAEWDAKWQSTAGVAMFSIINRDKLANADVPNINVGNDRTAALIPTYAFNTIVADAGVTYTFANGVPLYHAKFPITVSGDFANNNSAPNNNVGYSAGVVFGKSGKKGLWDITYRYKHIEANTWYEEFLNSDSGAYYPTALANSGQGAGYRPGTNIKGHEAKIQYSPFDALTLAATGYFLETINPVPGVGGGDIIRLQIDAVLKF